MELPIKLFDIEGAWESRNSDEYAMLGEPIPGYLNRQTGEVVFSNPEEYDSDLEDCPFYEDPNFLAIPNEFDWPKLDGFQMMSDFVGEVENPEIQKLLEQALEGRQGVFSRFKNVVHGDVATLKHWRWYQTIRERQSLEAWLKENDIVPLWDRDLYQRPELPSKRPELCLAVIEFLHRARKVNGVESISLIGSLTTEKKIPKDVDLVVQVSSAITDAQIQQLAQFTRQLSGKTMATGDSCGADVFLCDTNYQYLGRLCHYKDCHPRARCEAQSCGNYINDDLQNVTLDSQLMKSPPVVLWPAVKVNVELPKDVEELVVQPLMSES